MLRIDDSAPVGDRASRLADEIRQAPDARIAFRCTEADGRTRFMARVLAEVPDALFLHVPDTLDQTERVVLDVAQALGEEVAKETDAALRKEPEAPTTALGILGQALDSHRLLIDGWDRLGSSAADAEIGVTLSARTNAIRDWLAEYGTLFAVGWGRAPTHTAYGRWQPEEAPLVLVNGVRQPGDLWDRFAPDVRKYELALTLLALRAEPEDDAIERATDHGLRSRIVELLPESASHLLRLLAIHERPISVHLLDHSPSTIGFGVDIGLWRRMGSNLLVEKGWCRWWRWRLSLEQLRAVHRSLANLFSPLVYPDDPEAGRAGLALVEAHRHYLAAGELDKARAYARYGGALLVDTARQLSVEGQFEDAAELYGVVVAVADDERLPMGPKLRAYARHYLHYNRAHALLEGLSDTEHGYREALAEWPENALFWSRLVRVLFYDNRPAEALEETERARVQVPSHPQKETVLVARTVRGLLRKDRDRVLDAILMWNGYHPDTEQAREVEEQFAARLAEGWRPKHLTLIPEPCLFFTRPQEVQIERVAGGWLARITIVELASKGPSPLAALSSLVKQLRDEAALMIRAYTADLSPEGRLYKQRLLGAVDVVASRVDVPAPEAIWVFGDLHRDDEGGLWLHTGGSYDLWFEVPAPLANGVVVNDLPHFALVNTDAGVPTGPVEKLEPGIRRTEDKIWEEWRRRLSDAE